MTDTTPDRGGWYLDEYDSSRFWSRVNFHAGSHHEQDRLATAVGECWSWQGARNEAGYGRFTMHGSEQVAHRVAYRDFGKTLPDDLTVDHLCRNHSCVRPEHLEAVEHKVNVQRGANARKSHCVNGHPRDERNSRIYRDVKICRECARAAYKRKAERAA